MRRVSVAVAVAAGSLALGGVALAGTVKPKNGNFEAGNLSHWQQDTQGAQGFSVFDSDDAAGSGGNLPEPRGRFSVTAFQDDPGGAILRRTLKVPGKAVRIRAQLFWSNTATGFYETPSGELEFGDQYFTVDLIKKNAEPTIDRKADVLVRLFKPDTQEVPSPMPRAGLRGEFEGGPGASAAATPEKSGFRLISGKIKKGLRGKRVQLRVLTHVTANPLFVGIDDVTIKTKAKKKKK